MLFTVPWISVFFLQLLRVTQSIELEELPPDISASSLPRKRGFVTYGASSAVGVQSGTSIKIVGDTNNDGYDDYLIGAPRGTYGTRQYCGISYLLYGGPEANPAANVDLTSLSSSAGYRVLGVAGNDFSGTAVGGGFDWNNDGYTDLIIGAYNSDPVVGGTARNYAGTAYVVFGKAHRTHDVDLASLNSTTGFVIYGANQSDYTGRAVSRAGDINGDGYEDIVVGAYYATRAGRVQAGAAYVIFGGLSASAVDLKNLAPTAGFEIIGALPYAYTGYAVSNGGDFNNDGIDDLLVGAYGDGASQQGVAYVIFGKKSSSFGTINLSLLTSSQGISITGITANSQLGFSLSFAGDFNGDDITDIIVGAHYYDPESQISHGGAAYIIFGSTGINTNIQASSFPSSQGWVVEGWGNNYNLGVAVAGGGDVDHDGYDDVVIGANQEPVNGTLNIGIAYVLAGTPNTPAKILTSNWAWPVGFRILGIATGDNLGSSVDLAGDINHDGFADVIVSAPYASPLSRTNAGSTYVFYGENDVPTAIPTAVPTYVPTHVPTAIPTATPTAVPTATPTAIPTFTPTGVPSAIPTATPTFVPSNVPTIYSFPPSYTPTYAPTLNTNAQLTFDLTFNISTVSTSSLSSPGETALILAVQAVTGLPFADITFLGTEKTYPIPTGFYTLLLKVGLKLNLNTNPQYLNNLNGFCVDYDNKLTRAITYGNFTIDLQGFAAQLQASELYNAVVPSTLPPITSCAEIDNNPTLVPTFAPTLHTQAQLAFDITFNISDVKTSVISGGGDTAIVLAMAAVTGLPYADISSPETLKTYPVPTGLYTFLLKFGLKVNLNTNPQYVNNLNGLCLDNQNKLATAILNGNFTIELEKYAQQLQASELYSAIAPATAPPTATCTVINNGTNVPTHVPTFAPTLNTQAQLKFYFIFNISNVKADSLSAAGTTAITLAIQEITGLPYSEINVIGILTTTADPITRRLRRMLQTISSGYYTLLVKLSIQVSLSTNPQYANNLGGLCSAYQAAVTDAVASGNFTTLLQKYSSQVQASELLTAAATANSPTETTACQVVNNGTNSDSTNSAGSTPTPRLSDSVIAAIVILVIFFVILLFCLCYVGLAYYREKNEEKVVYEDPNDVRNPANQSAYSGITTSGEEFEMGDNTVMMFLSSEDNEEDADSFGFTHKKRKTQVRPQPVEEEGEEEEEDSDDDRRRADDVVIHINDEEEKEEQEE